jgi:formylglycine-generating enzyme required for sulfatase activity
VAELFPEPPPDPLPDEKDSSGPNRLLARLALEHLVSVDAGDPRLRNAYGLWHMLGNANEWTETVHVEEENGVVTPFPDSRFVKGGGWRSLRGWRLSFGLSVFYMESLATRLPDLGFRCAKSANP